MKKKFIAGITMLALMLSTTLAYADSTLTREYTFTTTDKEFNYTKNKTIRENGKKYKVKDISYDVLKKKEATIEKEFDNLTEKEVDKTIKVDGKEYKLYDVTYDEDKETVTETYTNYVTRPTIPDTKKVKLATGEEAEGKLINVDRSLSSTYNTQFTVPAKFYGDAEVEYYILGGENVPASYAPTFSGYKGAVLRYLNLDGNIYRVDSGRWTSDYYTENGQTVRNASFTGMQKTDIYTANYEASKYKAKAIYKSADGKTEYTVKATIKYEEDNTNLIKIAIGSGVLVIGAALSFLFYAAKKRKRKADTN